MAKTILDRLNQILIDKLYGNETGAHNVDAGNKINRTYDAGATYRPTNAQVVDELRRVYTKGSGSAASADYSKYKGNGNLFLQTLTEIIIPSADYFKSAFGVADSMFNGFVAVEKIDLSQLDTANWANLGDTFYGCESLRELIAPGNFISNAASNINLDLRYSPLTQACVEDLISKLANRKSTTAATITLKKDVYDEYVANHPDAVTELINSKNWYLEHGE